MSKMFKTTINGVGPFCVEFEDGEIITCRNEDRQRLIAAASELYTACELIIAVRHAMMFESINADFAVQELLVKHGIDGTPIEEGIQLLAKKAQEVAGAAMEKAQGKL